MSDVVSQIVEIWQARKQLGEDLPVDELLERYPELRERIVKMPGSLDLARGRILKLRQFQALQEGSTPAAGETSESARTPGGVQDEPGATAVMPNIPHYTIIDEIGHGGMGIVYRARQDALGRVCALKTISRKHRLDDVMVARFKKEVLAAASLNHPQIVTVYDLVRDGSTLYLAMEYVEGTDLEKFVEQHGPLELGEACRLIQQAARGLDHLRQNELVHRDIKPANLIRRPDGLLKILDFGIARLPAELRGENAPTASGLGTPEYMAPEQAEAQSVDTRTDVYALGCTFFYLLTGRAPFGKRRERSAIDILLAHRRDRFPDVRKIRRDVPDELWRILERMSAKAPQDRFATPGEVAEALARRAWGGQPEPAAPLPGNPGRPADSSDRRIRVPIFHCGSVVPPDCFIDREQELDDAEQIVRGGQNFLLVGVRRAGKSSFLKKLQKRLAEGDRITVLTSILNLEACLDLTIESFLGHTILNMIGEICREVFHIKPADLSRPDPTRIRPELAGDAAFDSLMNINRLVAKQTHFRKDAGRSAFLPDEFRQHVTDLLEIIRSKGWTHYTIFYDEANHLPARLSTELLTANIEALEAASLISVYAATPEMADSFRLLENLLGHRITIGPFDSLEDLMRLLRRYYHRDAAAAGELPIAADSLQRVWECAGGMPFQMQFLLSYSFKQAREQRAALVTEDHVISSFETLCRERPEYFDCRRLSR
jgi:serine/threonine protein kinase